MARKHLKAGPGRRHRQRSRWPRSSSIAARLEALEERRLLSVEPSTELDLLEDGAAEIAAPIAPVSNAFDVPVAEPAVIDVSGTSTTTAAGLLAYGGPGDPNLPGFNNVGKGSTGNTSVVYLGNGWVLTAGHVTIDNQYGPIRFGALSYQADMSSIRILTNANGTDADLKLFRLTTNPDLPSVSSSYLAAQAPIGADQVIMIGNGYTPSAEKFWRVSKTTYPWTWTEQSAPATPGPNDMAGWTYSTNRAMRWGDNRVEYSGLFLSTSAGSYIQGFITDFDNLRYTSEAGQPYEAQATSGDSGGAVFLFQNGRWVLGGIMVSVTATLSGQPGYTSLYGGLTYIADLSYYRDQILNVINPAPVASISGPSLGLAGELPTFTVSAQDSPLDMSAGFRFEIDWGDGTPLQIVNANAASANVSHAFATSGQLTVRVTAFDSSNQSSLPVTTTIHVDALRLVANANNPALVDLVWSGTSGADRVEFQQLADGNTIRVRETIVNGLTTTNVRDISGVTGRVIATGQEGDDVLDARGMVTKPVTLNGNAGNNILYGGAGGDILIGGSNGGEGQQGSNVIIAGNGTNTIYGNETAGRKKSTGGNNLIIGGTGQDTIYGSFGTNASTGGEGGQELIVGNGGADVIYASQVVDGAEGGKGSILISGSTTLGQAALQSVLAEWTSTHTYAQKLANIQGTGTADRLNGNVFLQAGVTVKADANVDQIYSDTNGDLNWLLITISQDLTYRLKTGETQTNLG